MSDGAKPSSKIDLNDQAFLEQIADFSLSGDGSVPVYRDEILAVGPPTMMNVATGKSSGTESAPDAFVTPKLSHLPSSLIQSRPAPSTINEEDEVIYENNKIQKKNSNQ